MSRFSSMTGSSSGAPPSSAANFADSGTISSRNLGLAHLMTLLGTSIFNNGPGRLLVGRVVVLVSIQVVDGRTRFEQFPHH